MLLGAVNVGVANVAGWDEARQGRLEGKGGIIDREQHILGAHAVEAGEQRGAEHAGALDLVEEGRVVEHDVDRQLERAGVLAYADRRDVTNSGHWLILSRARSETSPRGRPAPPCGRR